MGDLLQEGGEDLQEEKVFELIVLKQVTHTQRADTGSLTHSSEQTAAALPSPG